MVSKIEQMKESIPQQALAPLIDGTSLLSVVGLKAILSDKHIAITESQLKQAGKLSDKVLKLCKEFLSESEFKAINLHLKPLNFIEVQKAITQSIDIEWLSKKLEGFPSDETKLSFAQALGPAVQYLRQQSPVLPISITSKSIKPADFVVARFNRVYRTIDDPLTILTDMQMGCLSRSQVETLSVVYPSLYELYKSGLQAAAIELTAKDPNYQVSYDKLKQISVLLLSSMVPPDLQTLLQNNFVTRSEDPNNPENMQQSGSVPDVAKLTETKQQRIDNK